MVLFLLDIFKQKKITAKYDKDLQYSIIKCFSEQIIPF